MDTKLVTIGALSFSEEYYKKCKEENRCPCLVHFASGGATCSAWGSGTPTVHLKRECTFSDLKECPIKKHYPDEKLTKEWINWLKKKNLIDD